MEHTYPYTIARLSASLMDFGNLNPINVGFALDLISPEIHALYSTDTYNIIFLQSDIRHRNFWKNKVHDSLGKYDIGILFYIKAPGHEQEVVISRLCQIIQDACALLNEPNSDIAFALLDEQIYFRKRI